MNTTQRDSQRALFDSLEASNPGTAIKVSVVVGEEEWIILNTEAEAVDVTTEKEVV